MASKANIKDPAQLFRRIQAARGVMPCDLVIKNAQYLDVFTGAFRRGDVAVHDGVVVGIAEDYQGAATIDGSGSYIVPGFIDAHVHIESSLMTPARFEEAVLPCGTTTVMWDPHEIANVKGSAGIEWALSASEGLLLDVMVMVPSCVPSTSPVAGLETSGADLRAADLAPFAKHPRVVGLAEMMNFPGLLFGDADIMAKLTDFSGMRRDGHCPGLSGRDLNAYGVAGIHSCHESTTLPEAQEKLGKGIHVLIREGSCAKDADALLPVLTTYSSAVVALCSDDRNPADIAAAGHIDCIVNKGLRAGHDPANIFRAASYAAAKMYGLDDRGAIAPGYKADFCLVKPLSSDWRAGMQVQRVVKSGVVVDRSALQQRNKAKFAAAPFSGKNLNLPKPTAANLKVPASGSSAKCHVIGVRPRQILTEDLILDLPVRDGSVSEDLTQDVLKIAVFERHRGTGGHGVGFVKGMGLKRGAIATSINHDSHNVIAVGASDEAILAAIAELTRMDGGIVVTDGAEGAYARLPLPIGGLMTPADPESVTASLHELKALATSLGCALEEPFLQLSFLALPVIPSLKITDKGLVDVPTFKLIDVLLG